MRLFWPTIDMLIEVPGVVPSPAVCLDPRWFPSLGPPPSGNANFDTDSLEGDAFAGRGAVFQQGPAEPEIAVFVFDGGDLDGVVTLRGSRPAALLFQGRARVTARIDASRAGSRREGPGLAATPGAGGGFGGRGGAPGGERRGGPEYGLGGAFEVGSGGQRAASRGGLGGGGLQLGAQAALELRGARIEAHGEAGAPATDGVAGGGGSGGAVILHGHRVCLDPETSISVRGGDGGAGLRSAAGGGGGAGGYVLGASDPDGFLDPRGARFLTRGGHGGAAGAESPRDRAGRDGGRGVVYLAARRMPGPVRAPRRVVSARPRARA